jgi:hypothetical protein
VAHVRDPFTDFPFYLAEVPGTIRNLKPLFRQKSDYAVVIGKWRPTVGQPEPPLPCILRTALWSDEHYAGLRARLKRPVMETKVQFSGFFVSINTRTKVFAISGDEEVSMGSTQESLVIALPTPSVVRESVSC